MINEIAERQASVKTVLKGCRSEISSDGGVFKQMDQ